MHILGNNAVAIGTRADFWIGRGTDAEWLGSISWGGEPENLPTVLKQTCCMGYKVAVQRLLPTREDATLPRQGWPWPYLTSAGTDYAYTWDDGQLLVSHFGKTWQPANSCKDVPTVKSKVPMPNMLYCQDAVWKGPRMWVRMTGGKDNANAQ